MGQILSKIVLTGGPCAGKTTALALIEKELIEKGYTVLIVGESATELIKGGIKPFGKSKLDILKFQEIILQYQLDKEKTFDNAVELLPDEEKCVIIYDRGTMDNKAYVEEDQYAQILTKLGLNQLKLLDNYDMIIHLVTAADGKEEYYTLDNNTARTETIEEARQLDKKTIDAWIGHNNLKIIDNSSSFEEKMNKVVDHINNLLGNPISLKKQRKFLIDLNNSNIDFLNKENCIKIDIEQTYLIDSSNNNDYEKRLRKRTYKEQDTYYFTVQKKKQDGVSKIITDKKITEKEYLKMLSLYEKKPVLRKTRYAFTKEKQYFKLDVFEDCDSLAILEIDPTYENKKIIIPERLSIIGDVTDDPNFQNFAIADKSINKFTMKIGN